MSTSRSRGSALLLCTFLAMGCAASALPDKPILKDYELAQRDFPLKSGLRVLVQEDHSAPVVVVAAMYAVGSTSDPKGLEGLAHFIEHLAFRSRPGGGPELMHVIDRMGGFRNAFTTLDKTVYFTMAHKDHLNELMQLEAWRLARTVDGVTPEVFATEREVVRNELRLGNETNLRGKLFDKVLAQLFPAGHPFSRPVIGSHESLSAAKLEDARAFIKKDYTPDNCTIVISGDVNADEVQKLLGQWPAEILFGPAGPDGPAVQPRQRYGERPVPAVPPPVNRALVKDKGPIEQPILVLGWSAPAAYRGNDELLSFVSTRLNLALQEVYANSDIYVDDDIESVGAFADPLAEATVVYVVANLKPGADPEKARQRVLDTLVNAWTTELGRLDVEVTRWFAATDLLLAVAEPFDKAVSLVQHLGATGHPAFFKDSLEGLAAVKNSQVMEFAAKWITRERAVAVYFEPESDFVPKVVGGSGAARAPAKTGASTAEHQIGGEQATVTEDLGADKIRLVTPSPDLARFPSFKLTNGLEVFAIPHGLAPVAQIHLGIRGGNATVKPFGLAGLASNLSRSMCREHGSLLAVGGRMGSFTGLTRSTHRVNVMSGNLANGLAVLGDQVRCQEVSEESFLFLGRILEINKKAYDRIAKKPEFVASKRFWAELYPGHAYGELAMNPEALKGVTREEAAAYVSSHYKPENAVAVVTGDVEAGEVKALAERYLATWKSGGGGSAAVAAIPPGPAGRKVFLIERPKATQATIQIGCRIPALRPEWLPAHDVLEAMANDHAWKLREQLGATYGIYAGITGHPGGAADLTFGGAVVNPLVGEVVAKLLGFIEDAERGHLDEGWFLSQRWDVARKFALTFATSDGIASGILQAADLGFAPDVWNQYPDNLAKTTRETLASVVAGCAGKEIVTVVGDPVVIRPQLEKAGLKLETE